MSTTRDIDVIVGSLRKQTLNRKMANDLIELAPAPLALEILEIRALPLFDDDLEADAPAEWTRFRERVRRADGVIFVTPEYNRSVPGVLKNAIDVASRPNGKSAWNGKPAGVVSVSPGAIGGFGANHHLRQSLVFLNMPTMPQPSPYIGGAGRMFDEAGRLSDASTREFMGKFMTAYAEWTERFAAKGWGA
jgi:chromate reductase